MLISLIGSNGLLSNSVGIYSNNYSFSLNVYGRTEPKSHFFTKFHKIDLLYELLDYIELAKSDLIVYAAGTGIQFHLNENKDSIYTLNVTTPVTICNQLNAIGYKGTFVTFGSYFEIGENIENKTFSEIDILQSQLRSPNDYAISKRMLTRFIGSLNPKAISFTFLHFILPTIYGEFESNYRLIPYTLKAIRDQANLTLTSGEQIRQYVYIHDVVKLIFLSVDEKIISGIYNIAGVEEFSVKQLVGHLFELNNKKVTDDIFGKTQRVDVDMKILKLNGKKLKSCVSYVPCTKIMDVYDNYIL